MKKTYIYGAGRIGNILARRLNKIGIVLDGFIDKNKTGKSNNIEIYGLDDIDISSTIIIAILNIEVVIDACKLIRSKGFTDIYWYNYFGEQEKSKDYNTFLNRECVNTSGWGELVVPHVEFHIADNCNLNCKGCTHFSPLFSELGDTFENRIAGLEALLKKVSSIAVLDILGGEPLLNPELSQYIKSIKELCPNTFVDIFTNGLLIPQLPKKTLECIREYDIPIFISEYKPTHKMLDSILKTLDDYDIRYMTSGYEERQIFNIPLSISENTKYPRKCISEGCATLAGFNISRCPTLMYVSKFNEEFEMKLPTTGIINLNSDISGKVLLDLLKEKIPLCDHCIKCDTEWGVCNKKRDFSDFAVSD